jgi:hypothetical protein
VRFKIVFGLSRAGHMMPHMSPRGSFCDDADGFYGSGVSHVCGGLDQEGGVRRVH